MLVRLLIISTALGMFVATQLQQAHGQSFFEPFSTDTATAGTTYNPPFTFTPGTGGTAVVTGGVLMMNNTASSDQTFLRPGLAGSQRLSGDVGASNSGGSYNVGMQIGENNIVFHPGLAGGAFRIEGNGGFGNSTMGFTPANGTLYRMDVDQFASLGVLRVSLTDTANPANVYRRSIVNPDSIGGTFGFRRSGPNNGDGRFDNLRVTPPVITPVSVASQSFNINTANTAAFLAAYPEFTYSGDAGNNASTNAGILNLTTISNSAATVTRSGLSGELIVKAQVGADNSNGNYNVGLNIGGHNLVFHPGLNQGAFRVEGPNGFGNTNMGFTPANDVLHDMTVHIFENGLFDISVVDGSNPQNIFHASFVDPTWSGLSDAQRDIGFHISGPNGVGLFDNLNVFQVQQVAAVPEPTTFALWTIVGLGAAGCAGWRRRRK